MMLEWVFLVATVSPEELQQETRVLKPGMVVHACNLSCSGHGGRKIGV
jgi:hypothetical protein